MHKRYEVLKDITLPGETGIVTGRIYNWLRDLNHKIKPASCFVVDVPDIELEKFFISVATKLVESAGVNIVVDRVPAYISAIQKKQTYTGAYIFDSNATNIDLQTSDVRLYKVADSLMLSSESSKQRFPEHISIFEAWELAYRSCFSPRVIYIDFADVRLPDEISSGRLSFMDVTRQIIKFALNPSLTEFLKCLSDICATIKRGGFRRHGAMTASLESISPSIHEYLDIPFGYLTHLKKGVLIRSVQDLNLISKLIEKQNKGELFFEKHTGFSRGIDKDEFIELRTNVCRGLSLIPGDQCLVSPVNLGMCRTVEDIVTGFKEVTQFLVDVHNKQIELGFPLLDKQIAVGICGLANLLRNFNVTYPDFIEALYVRNLFVGYNIPTRKDNIGSLNSRAVALVNAITEGVWESAKIGKVNGMRATLAIEPNESCSRRYKDYQGYDICPNIDPPDVVPGVGIERRHSETGVYDNEGNLIHPEFNYGADIFPASYLTERQHFLLWDGFMKLFAETKQSHSGSYEQWYPLTLTSFFEWWVSDLKYIYYNRSVGTKHLVKAQNISARDRLVKNLAQLREQIKPNETCTLAMRAEGCESCD